MTARLSSRPARWAARAWRARWRLAPWTLVAATLAGGAWWVVRAIPLPARLAQPPSTVVSFVDGSPAYVFLSPDDKYRMQASLEAGSPGAIDPDYVEALLRFEDKRFWRHPGVDPVAVARSALVNLRAGRVVTGASTLSMQLVRVLEPRPRTLRSKALEALRALHLELRLSKREILAAYLSFVPYGRNVEGVRAASHAYFGHGPEELSADEIAVLLAVPQRPSSRYPTAANRERLTAARDEIATWLIEHRALPRARATGESGAEAADRLRAEVARQAVPARISALPRHAAHAAFWLRGQHPGATEIETTLDRGAQRLAEARMAGAHPGYARLGIHNGAVVVVDHRSAEVRALVGNFDFWDAGHGGQIAGFATPRSPGSALKPLLYAMALDRGLALPEHLVADVPVRYGDYAPENYDGEFAGLVELEDALSLSLNVPFVRLLSQVGVEPFVGLLRAGGATGLRTEPGYYGLSAAIGSVEVTPLEVAGLYAALAEEGRYRRLAWLRSEALAGTGDRHGVSLLSPGASYLTRRALVRRDRPDFPQRRRFSGVPSAIHWKTGTSYGHRDAWAAGSGPSHTVVVWLGNFDNRPSVDLVGAEAAGPLLFDLLEAFADRATPALPEPWPPNLKTVRVCAYSGHLPTRACPHGREVLALADHVPTARCPCHVAVDVDLASGLALSPSCRAGRRWERRSFVVWPATLRRFMNRGRRWMAGPPAPALGCEPAAATAALERTAPRILSPPAGQVVVLLAGVPASDQELPLEAETSGHAERLSWFVDGEFLGQVDAEQALWWTPTPGRHELLLVDDSGASSRRRLEVRAGRLARAGAVERAAESENRRTSAGGG